MITLERTRNWEVIKAIVTHRRVYPHVSDDASPLPDLWEPVKDDAVWYVLVKDDDLILGLWILIPDNSVCWKIHTCLLPAAYGDRSRAAVAALAPWIWKNTGCLRVITDVPDYNRIALKFAKDAGMEQYGVNPRSYMKNNILYDQILLGISKPVTLCQ